MSDRIWLRSVSLLLLLAAMQLAAAQVAVKLPEYGYGGLFSKSALTAWRSLPFTFQQFLQLVAVKAYYDIAVFDCDWRGQVSQSLQFGQRRFVRGYVAVGKINLVL